MQRVLFLIPTLKGGGAEKILVDLVKQLKKETFVIEVRTLFHEGPYFEELQELVTVSWCFPKQFRGNSHVMKILSPQMLYRLAIPETYDLIVSFLEGPSTRILAGCPDDKIKKIAWVHNEFHSLKELGAAYRTVKELSECYAKMDQVVFVSQTAQQAFHEILPVEQSCVLYNPLDFDKCETKSQMRLSSSHFDKKGTRLITIGRLAYQKGYDRLLNSLNRLISEGITDFSLQILGEGEEAQTLKATCEKLGLDPYVEFVGFVDNPYAFLAASDLFVAPSRYEGYSTVITEATVLGVPVLATNCSGMEEILKTTGWITENDEVSFYQKLKEILQKPEKIDEMRLLTKQRGEELRAVDYMEPIKQTLYTYLD
ncbi:MAG: glycosyltransferase [Enterococcus sp.]